MKTNLHRESWAIWIEVDLNEIIQSQQSRAMSSRTCNLALLAYIYEKNAQHRE
jgi:hypothetical protein